MKCRRTTTIQRPISLSLSLYIYIIGGNTRFQRERNARTIYFRTHTRAFICYNIYMYIYIYMCVYIYTYNIHINYITRWQKCSSDIFFYFLLSISLSLFLHRFLFRPCHVHPLPRFPCVSQSFSYSFLDNLVHLYLYIIYIIDLYSRKVVFNN